jgi:hypothetical protein
MSVRSYSLPAPRDVVVETVLKFLAAFTLGMMIYGLAVLIIAITGEYVTGGMTLGYTGPPSGFADGGALHALSDAVEGFGEFVYEQRAYILMMTLPAIPAALMFLHLPERTVDRYHRFGKAFAMFVVVNLTLSGMFLLNEFHIKTNSPELNILTIIFYFSVASAFLPGPYLGILIGARWSR